jgi:hypothetical protein
VRKHSEGKTGKDKVLKENINTNNTNNNNNTLPNKTLKSKDKVKALIGSTSPEREERDVNEIVDGKEKEIIGNELAIDDGRSSNSNSPLKLLTANNNNNLNSDNDIKEVTISPTSSPRGSSHRSNSNSSRRGSKSKSQSPRHHKVFLNKLIFKDTLMFREFTRFSIILYLYKLVNS